MSSASTLARERCFNHLTREAVSRCTRCSRSYCRECVVDHECGIVCAACLAKQPKSVVAGNTRSITRGAAAIGGFFVTWLFFYALGSILVNLPSSLDVWSGR